MSVPQGFHIEEQSDGYWLWLEDIVDMYEQRWPIARFGLAAQHLARFSGAYLVGAEIPTYSWLTKDKDLIRHWKAELAGAIGVDQMYISKIERSHDSNVGVKTIAPRQEP